MYINETYDKYFNLDFPGPVPETKLHESAASDALKNLETELASLEAEIKDLKKKHGAAWSKYDKELSSTPEYQALKKEYNELWRELSHLELSYRRYDRNDPDGGEWEMDEKIYDEVKDRIAELNDKLDSMKKDYWAPSNQARAKADAEFGSAEKEQRLKQGKEEHAQNLQTLIEEETPEINQILEELNSGLAESEKFTAAFKGCYFKAGKLWVPIFTPEFEDEYEYAEADFKIHEEGFEASDYEFDWEAFEEDSAEGYAEPKNLLPEQLADFLHYSEEAEGYRINENSDWLLSKQVGLDVTKEPKVTEVVVGHDDYNWFGPGAYVEEVHTTGLINYSIVCYLCKTFN